MSLSPFLRSCPQCNVTDSSCSAGRQQVCRLNSNWNSEWKIQSLRKRMNFRTTDRICLRICRAKKICENKNLQNKEAGKSKERKDKNNIYCRILKKDLYIYEYVLDFTNKFRN